MKKDVRDRVVLITGGSRGLGRRLADRFASDGAVVVLWARTEADLDAAACELRDKKSCDAHWYSVDVSDPDAVLLAAQDVKKEVGTVDVLVNNAGVVHGGPFLEVSAEQHRQTMEVNFNASMWTLKAFLPDMVERNDGHVINISSGAGLTYMPELTSYCASKAALINFTDALRLELKDQGKDGVRFLIVCPGFVETGMFEGVKVPGWLPWLDPDDVADKVYSAYHRNTVYLAEPAMGKLAPLFRALVPRRSLDFWQRVTGLSGSMEEWRGHNR